MRSRTKKTCAIVSSVILLTTVSVFIITCADPTGSHNASNQPGGELPDTPDGDTRLVVAMHDAPFKMEGKDVQELNLTVEQIVIIDSSDRHITILQTERELELLGISRSDPVVLSDVSVEPGTYKELRLVLKDNSTIKVDGELYPIKIPSGSQSGLKLKGPFAIPNGKLFRLVIDFVASESVHWNKGQGWMLKPVLRISDAAEIIGIFRGNLTVSGNLGARETLVQLYANNTARLRISDYPRYTLHCDYTYNSVLKKLIMTDISLDAPGLRKRALKKVMKKIPDRIELPVKQWSLDSIIAIDTSGLTVNLYRVDAFNFSPGVSFTEFTLNVDYPDASKSGKDVLTEIRFIDTGMPPLISLGELDGGRFTDTVQVLNSSIQGSSTRIRITSYLFDRPEDMNVEAGTFASLPYFYMAGSYFSATTDNLWQQPDIFTLIRDAEGQEFTVSFRPRLNIKMQHENFTNNNPVIIWDPYPGAANGYFVLVMTEDKKRNSFDDGSDAFAIAYHAYAREPRVQIYSNRIKFTTTYTTAHEIPPSITAGDMIRIEVFVLDGSGTLNTRTRQGAFLMDSAAIIR